MNSDEMNEEGLEAKLPKSTTSEVIRLGTPEDMSPEEVCIPRERVVLLEIRHDGTEVEHYRF